MAKKIDFVYQNCKVMFKICTMAGCVMRDWDINQVHATILNNMKSFIDSHEIVYSELKPIITNE